MFKVLAQASDILSSISQETREIDGAMLEGGDDTHLTIRLPDEIKKSERETMMRILRAQSYVVNNHIKRSVDLQST